MHAGAVILGSVDMGDERNAVVLLSKDAGFVGEPVMGVNKRGLIFHEVFVDEFAVRFLNITDRDELMFMSGDDFLEELHGFVGATAVAVNRVEVGGGEDLHEVDVFMLGFIWNDEIDIGALARKSPRHIQAGDTEATAIVRWEFPA